MRHTLIVAALLAGTGMAFAQDDTDGARELPSAAQSMEGFTEISFDELTPEDLSEAMLLGADGGEIGPVASVLPVEGEIGDVMVDVGDLIDMGETQLAFQPVDMVAMRSEEGELRLVSRMTRDDVAAVAASAAN